MTTPTPPVTGPRAVGQRLGRGARRIVAVLRHAGWLTVVALGAVVVVIGALVVRAALPPSGPDVAATSPARVGVSDGDVVPEYVGAAKEELSRLAGSTEPVYALISFTSYLSPDELAATLAGVSGDAVDTAAVFALARVPVSRRQTEIVRLAAQRLPADVVAAMGETAVRKDRDSVAYGGRADTATDANARSLYRSNAELSATEAAAYRARCACVFAAVVRAPPATLAQLSTVTRVRAVDPAPEITDLTRAVFVAPLPEHVDVVAPLPDDLTFSDGVLPTSRSS